MDYTNMLCSMYCHNCYKGCQIGPDEIDDSEILCVFTYLIDEEDPETSELYYELLCRECVA